MSTRAGPGSRPHSIAGMGPGRPGMPELVLHRVPGPGPDPGGVWGLGGD